MTKVDFQVNNTEADSGDGNGQAHGSEDAKLQRLGVAQQLKRRFGLLSLVAFTTAMMCTWESAIPFFVTPFLNGGGPAMISGFIVAFFGALATCASMAEMASMYPVSGGQYHWVALLAPKGKAKFLSWLTGWVSMLGWQAAASTGTYLAGTTIQALLALNVPGYEAPRWHATLIMYAVLLLTIFVNTILVRLLPGLEGLILILHVVGFFAVLIPIVHLAPISPNAFVWTEFVNRSGYGSDALSWFVGQSASAVLFIGYDGACHMAEEVANASSNVPKAMVATVCINGALGLATYIFILYCFGNPDETLATPFGQPFIQIFDTALNSTAATTALTCLLLSLYIFATFNFVASASRQAWAFSRDNGLPYSRFFSRVDKRRAIPLWTIVLTGTVNVLLGLINVGSSVAFNAVVSLVVSSFLTSYFIPIILMITKRLRREKIEFGPWTLGRWGLPINIFAACYTLIAVVFTFFPPSVPVTKMSMNYSCVVYGGVIIGGLVYYVTRARKIYVGPSLDVLQEI